MALVKVFWRIHDAKLRHAIVALVPQVAPQPDIAA
jgi:hypothetical protein